jgi:membrane-associated phospholipid phosphatase
MRGLCSGAILALSLSPAGSPLPAQADSAATRPPAAVTRGDVLRLGAAGALAALAYAADEPVRDAVRGAGPQANGPLRTIADVTDVYGQGGAVGLAAAAWGAGLVAREPVLAAAGLRALEAITVSGVVTKVIKGVAGRARPRVAPHRHDDFDLGRGFGVIDGDYESLPSGHATVAFAFAAAVTGEVARRAPARARLVGVTTHTLAALTAYSRVHVDAHWLSDITLGAGVGLVSGWAVTRWHATRPGNWVDRTLLRGEPAGPQTAGRGAVRLDVSLARDGATRLGVVVSLR